MNTEAQIAVLKQQLVQTTALYTLFTSPEFQIHLLPYLKQLATVEYIDPEKYQSKELYLMALDKANTEAGVYSTLIKFLSGQEGAMKSLTEQINKPVVSKGI